MEHDGPFCECLWHRRIIQVTTRTAHRVPERVRLKRLTDAPEPLCIAVGHLANRVHDKPLAVFVEELRKAAPALA